MQPIFLSEDVRRTNKRGIDIDTNRLAALLNVPVAPTVAIDGLGMDVDQVDQTQHFGLLGIRERIQGFHGQFSVESSAKSGTKIVIKIPKESIA